MENFEIKDLSVDERHTLARKVGISPAYLWQCGVGLKVPSLPVADKMMKLEPRLTVAGLLAPKRRRDKQSKTK